MSERSAKQRFVDAMQAIAEGLGSEGNPYCTECGNSRKLVESAVDAFADADCLAPRPEHPMSWHVACRATLRKEIGLE